LASGSEADTSVPFCGCVHIETIGGLNRLLKNGCRSDGRLTNPSQASIGCPLCRLLPLWSNWRTWPNIAGSSSEDYQELKPELGLRHYEGRG
jgi:hypothetical protein